MRTETTSVVFRQHEIPEAIRALDVLPSHYVDVLTAEVRDAAETSPELWSRAALEEASAVGRFLAWETALGLRLDKRPSPDRVAGWRIADRGERWIRLEADSWSMAANILFHVGDDDVTFATLIRYDRTYARMVWTPLSAVHRQLAPQVLWAAVRRIARRRNSPAGAPTMLHDARRL